MIYVYTLSYCPYCHETIKLLDKYKLVHTVIEVDDTKDIYKKKHKLNTFPQIFITQSNKKVLIGGYNELINILEIMQNIKTNKILLPIINYFSKKLK
jgi:glutaredoxin